jgi:hypothetical protein
MQAGFFPFFSSSIFKRYCKSGFCYLSCEGQKIYHKGFYYANFFASLLFRLINANISVNDFNEQPEWFHWPWAHRQWPFYTYCMSCTRFKSGSFYRAWYFCERIDNYLPIDIIILKHVKLFLVLFGPVNFSFRLLNSTTREVWMACESKSFSWRLHWSTCRSPKCLRYR